MQSTSSIVTSAFSRLVEELLDDHLTDDNEPEGALLPMLYSSIASSSGTGSAPGGSTVASAPIDLGALELWDSIAREIRECNPDSGSVYSELDLLRLWIAESGENFQMQLELMERMARWRDSILGMFNPPKLVPLRGVDCPLCKATKDLEGELPLTLNKSASPPYATCSNCGGSWHGGELLELRAEIGKQERNHR